MATKFYNRFRLKSNFQIRIHIQIKLKHFYAGVEDILTTKNGDQERKRVVKRSNNEDLSSIAVFLNLNATEYQKGI